MNDCPRKESKSHYLTKKLVNLFEEYNFNKNEHNRSRYFVSLKVIIFSQFRQILNVVGDRLLRRFGPARIAEYWGSYRSQELSKFVHDDRCFVLLLGKDGSHGLDLSFVTHIFFMDEILDKSLESQVISRAYRMGANTKDGRGVVVEKLVARDTIEEIIEASSKSGYQKDDRDKSEQQTKLHFLLKRLKPIRKLYQREANAKRMIQSQSLETIMDSLEFPKEKKSKVRFE